MSDAPDVAREHGDVAAALPAYELLAEVGRGGWGVVLRARHRELDRDVAVKQLPRAVALDPAVRSRFKDEARLVARLNHPHITPVYDFVERDGLCLLVMEYLPGGTVWRRFRTEGLAPDVACAVTLVTCAALEHAHGQGVLHRDVKPENLLIGEGEVIKLSDFGIAKVLGAASSLTATGQVMGTPSYMAPEQVLGRPSSPATDVYACGTMLYEMLSGELPFPPGPEPIQAAVAKVSEPAVSLAAKRPDLPASFVAIVMRALSTEPEERHQRASELAIALALAATEVFGPGWLRRSGVRLDASGEVAALTERAPGRRTPAVGSLRRQVTATAEHERIGELVTGGARPTTSPTGVVSAPPTNAPVVPQQAEPDRTRPRPGWYPDPYARHAYRWWSGRGWTEHASTAGVQYLDPVS